LTKLHCQLNHRGNLPAFVVMSDGKMHDVTAVKNYFDIEPDSIYCANKAYMALPWFKQVDDRGADFLARLKKNADIIKRVTSSKEY